MKFRELGQERGITRKVPSIGEQIQGEYSSPPSFAPLQCTTPMPPLSDYHLSGHPWGLPHAAFVYAFCWEDLWMLPVWPLLSLFLTLKATVP